jgi:selenocysteine-specific translation elongation factor
LIYIVGCQNDRDNHIAKDQILNKYKRVKYFSTSAKTNEGVSDFFSTLENDLVKQEKKKKQATH